ncbi:MAG: hypothetical protein M1147_06285 [Nitrospirae bacterium]|nr:hypothetical protein [Nitrospirota bacterium]MCL5977725.1 hypothetical protein [Nitrospirota bacterium]
MTPTLQIIISLLTAIGIGGILGAYFQSRFQRQKEISEDIHNLKRQRYGAILIQMLTILNPERGLSKAQAFRPDLKSVDDFREEVKTEILHSVLFADDEVIKSLVEFIRSPSHATYIKTVVSMRNDLWNKKTIVNEETLNVLYENKSKSA